TVLWAYARGANLSKEGETGIDVIAYAAHIACQLGAHIIKVKPPTAHLEVAAAKKAYEGIEVGTLEQRIRHVVQSCFGGRRMVIFSGGPSKGYDAVIEEARGIAAGGGFGAIVGRNAFQRPHKEAVKLLGDLIAVYRQAAG
ncbi:MAG: fructose-bisphosphate aldolase, partial [Myxococcota bacterium]